METSYVTLKEAGTKRKHLAFVRAKLATAVAIGIQKNIPTSSEHLGLKSEQISTSCSMIHISSSSPTSEKNTTL